MRAMVAGLIAFAALSGVAFANETTTPRCLSQLQLRVRGDGTRVSSKDALSLTVEIVNTSRDSVWLYGDLTYGVWLWVYDASGKEVPPKTLFEHLPPPPRTSDYLALRPAHSLVLHDTYLNNQLGLAAGRYTAKIEFHLLSARPDLNIPACSGKLDTADTVSFEVVE